MSRRDPFPFPKFENGFTLSGFRPQQVATYDKPAHIAQTEEPWCRLHDTATLASSRRSSVHYEHQAPKDSLDFQLKSVYDHHKDFFWFRNQMLYQKETVSEGHRSVQPHCAGSGSSGASFSLTQQEDIRVWVDPQRNSIHSIK
uniref:Uncharacterized protein n=1 Tax=Cyclopterus lumpus TaxID=8103 RepID=A0A8C2Z8M3_CYCLU